MTSSQTLGLYRNCLGRKNLAQSCLVCRGSPDRDLPFMGSNISTPWVETRPSRDSKSPDRQNRQH